MMDPKQPPKNARGRPTDSPEVRYSKTLSYILRHGAIKEGLEMRNDGFIRVDDLLSRPKLRGLDFELLQQLVLNNDKKRYQLVSESGVWFIRAVQGHSLDTTQLELSQILSTDEAPVVIHGTNDDAWSSIKVSGLKTMGRQYIHLAAGMPKEAGVVSGMRNSSTVFIYVDVGKVLRDDIKLYKSLNGVILTSGIENTLSPQYFSKVENNRGEIIHS
ncbi:hypothetical protein E3P77_03400 [Wallemia ichthyophaga]|nr:hypothetical protein E3P91_02270 [Wallemia ichthyophaga]TIB04453.1 hypothetical protein E3P95_00176 [Wallemia ichthyophaga]TIB05507.1 hypothetical protein E3P94_00176 [Wallemia ichthyophaga]TIB60209.1 hypothetical protein E3P78_03228 [Wallemia ichthyophaga]TIB63709.1 hypothetical protein E3P77_03400 [Wallemia ichthyophaga]